MSTHDAEGASSAAAETRHRRERAASRNVNYSLKRRRVNALDEAHDSTSDNNNNNTPSPSVSTGPEPAPVQDPEPIAASTGQPLSSGPSEKVKKESLWHYKKHSGSLVAVETADTSKYTLNTQLSEKLTRPSALRRSVSVRLSPTPPQLAQQEVAVTPRRPHIKIKNSHMSSTKLFHNNFMVKNNIAGAKSSTSNESSVEPQPEHENDDWCAACMQPGSFLCCDTCSNSFHFLCLDPPVDPDNLPEGDWSCPHCLFTQQFPTQPKLNKAQRSYAKDVAKHTGSAMFAGLLFNVQGHNPRQFELPHALRSTFAGVHTTERAKYADETEKPPVPYRLLANAPYGQSVSKLDSYAPDNHYAPNEDQDNDRDHDDENNPHFLCCYRCKQTRFGSWEHPEDSRLLITCDYCNTPWHLDCVPDVPRASLKNLGYKWKCPLHANTQHGRRLARKQHRQCRPTAQSCGDPNNGDIEITLEPVQAPGSITMVADFEKMATGDAVDIVPVVPETAVKTDFISKVYSYKQLERRRNMALQARLVDKLVTAQHKTNGATSSQLADIVPLMYLSIAENATLKKQWNFSELCNVAKENLGTAVCTPPQSNDTSPSVPAAHLSQREQHELLTLKRLLESKPKSDIMKFFGLDK